MTKGIKEPEIADDRSRSYSHLIHGVRDGDTNAEATRELKRLLERIEEEAYAVGKAKGSITVTLNFASDRRGNTSVTSDVKVKLPKPSQAPGHMWLLKGKLANEDPKQMKLGELREVASPGTKEPVAPAHQEAR